MRKFVDGSVWDKLLWSGKSKPINYQKYFGTNANNSKIFTECGKTSFEYPRTGHTIRIQW